MPFVAICKECGWVTLSRTLRNVGFRILEHFGKNHKRTPRPHPWRLNMEDFKAHSVFLDNFQISSGYYIFQSKIFYSYDYCIAVITNDDYNFYKDNDNYSYLYNYFKSYFPNWALQKDRTMICIKEFDDVFRLSNDELKNLLIYILLAFKKRNLLEMVIEIFQKIEEEIK